MARKLSRRALSAYIAGRLIEGASEKEVATHVAAYLLETRRTNELELIIRDVQLRLAEQGKVTGTVTSAFELADESKKAIEAFVKDKTGATDVVVDTVVDPTVLGGVKITLPGREFDATVARALTTLKTRYKKA
jgi:F-type H+-transporting ATPase subunit delta